MQEVQRIDRDIYRVIFETEPVEAGESHAAGLTYQNLLRTPNKEIVNTTARKLDSMIRHMNRTESCL